MEIYLPDDPDALKAKLSARILPAKKGVICPDKVREYATQVRRRMVGEEHERSPLFMTGHQPLFYPPGILIKNLLAGALAKALGGSAVNLVVDTDEEELIWRYPVVYAEGQASGGSIGARETVTLNHAGTVLGEQDWDGEKRDAFLRAIAGAYEAAGRIFPDDRARTVRDFLERVKEFALTARRPFDAAVCLRESFERDNGLSLRTVYVSDLVATNAYGYFLDVIRRNASRFRATYNEALGEYRRSHKIKNPAQPLPDLNDGELPFWVLKDGRRIPLREDENIDGRTVLPRAVTLTLFARLFLCDLFIHGRGGARYDRITDAILRSFFDCEGAPFTVASATLALKPRERFPLRGRPAAEIRRDLRDFRFDPARFLPGDHPLRRRRAELIGRRRAQDADLKQVHQEFMNVRKKAREQLADFYDELLDENERAALVQQNQDVFHDREYPFFFYDLTPLHEAVRPFAEMRNGTPAASK